MLSNDARREIRDLILRHTAQNTVDKKTARAALVRRGVYTRGGDLTPEYGGDGPVNGADQRK